MRKRRREKESNGDSGKVVQVSIEDNSVKGAKDKKESNASKEKKTKNVKNTNALAAKHDRFNTETGDDFDERNDNGAADQSQFENAGAVETAEVVTEAGKPKKSKKRKKKDSNSLEFGKSSEKGVEAALDAEVVSEAGKPKKSKNRKKKVSNSLEFGKSSEKGVEAALENYSKGTSSISKKASKKKKRDLGSSPSKKTLEREVEADQDVYLISSSGEDSTKGMKKWISEYHQSRPGLKVLQQRIDEFIIAHDEKLEQERNEKEARAAEGGWTVVVQHKGRKKTTDAESGITVGSVAQAAVEDKVAKKKSNEVGLDFYRFQRKEAQRNEIMMLQSKFEQDKKRIQQLRAARKFRP